MKRKLSIREAAERYRISARTLRFYEEAGILKSCRRENSLYREYDDTQIKRIEIILLLRRLSFTVSEIDGLLNGGDFHFRDALQKRIARSDKLLLEAQESNLLLRKLSEELSKKPPGDISAADILNDFLYLTKQTERMNKMIPFEESPYRIALGTDICIEVAGENGGNIIGKIKKLRAEQAEKSAEPLPVIRLYDTEDIPPAQAVIFWDGKEVWNKDYAGISAESCCDDIVERLRELSNS